MGLFRSYAKFKMGKKAFDYVMRRVRANQPPKKRKVGRRRLVRG